MQVRGARSLGAKCSGAWPVAVVARALAGGPRRVEPRWCRPVVAAMMAAETPSLLRLGVADAPVDAVTDDDF